MSRAMVDSASFCGWCSVPHVVCRLGGGAHAAAASPAVSGPVTGGNGKRFCSLTRPSISPQWATRNRSSSSRAPPARYSPTVGAHVDGR